MITPWYGVVNRAVSIRKNEASFVRSAYAGEFKKSARHITNLAIEDRRKRRIDILIADGSDKVA